MEEGRSSETAAVAAMLRAVHPLLDAKPWILNDDLAGKLVGMNDRAAVLSALRTFEEELVRTSPENHVRDFVRNARVNVTLRARYAEDELDEAVRRGVSQYVILGSGFDSFAYRRRDSAAPLRVYEVDYPASLCRKQARLAELGVHIPPDVVFVPLDFERQPILEALQGQGYCREEPAFFSWLGVTWYLTEEAVVRTLEQVAGAAAGSEIVFDYVLPDSLVDEEGRHNSQLDRSMVAARGEPGRTCFEPARLAERMQAIGFGRVWDMGPKEAGARYLSGRSDGLRFPTRIHLAKGRVDHPARSE